jgi:hypothetical protein
MIHLTPVLLIGVSLLVSRADFRPIPPREPRARALPRRCSVLPPA